MLNLENKNSNILNVEVKNYGECGYCLDGENKATLNIPWAIWSQWLYVSQQMGSKEWGAVFWVKDNAITHFKIPKQEVTSTECEFKEELGGDGIVHSHHDMGAFHSSQDDHHARNLYLYSIVISTKGCAATKKIKLPCKGFGYLNVKPCLTDCPDTDLSKIAEKKQELLSEIDSTHQQELDFGMDDIPCDKCISHNCNTCRFSLDSASLPCDRCDSFECKKCNFTGGTGIRDILPFCDFYEDCDSCSTCPKLAKYLDNYPEDEKHFGYLLESKS